MYHFYKSLCIIIYVSQFMYHFYKKLCIIIYVSKFMYHLQKNKYVSFFVYHKFMYQKRILTVYQITGFMYRLLSFMYQKSDPSY